MNDGTALLCAMIAHPDEDTPRLAYADWLDEHLDQYGHLPDAEWTAHRDRGEFIRVQCELARRSPCPDKHYYFCGANPDQRCFRCQFGLLQVRESALLTAHGLRWRVADWPMCRDLRRAGVKITDCPQCQGTHDAGGLMRAFEYEYRDPGQRHFITKPVRVEYGRGFITRVIVPRLTDCVEEQRPTCMACFGARRVASSEGDRQVVCPICHGRGYESTRTIPSPCLTRVLTATPERRLIREVVPLDREPQRLGDSYFWFHVDGSHHIEDPAVLPLAVYSLIKEYAHPTRAAALSALGRALAAFGRL